MSNLNPSPEEISQESSRNEFLLEPLLEIGVNKQQLSF